MAKKPKPATAGEKIAASFTINHYTDRPRLARRIDAALKRERMKERRRCSRIVVAWIGGEIDDATMLAKVRSGEAMWT